MDIYFYYKFCESINAVWLFYLTIILSVILIIACFTSYCLINFKRFQKRKKEYSVKIFDLSYHTSLIEDLEKLGYKNTNSYINTDFNYKLVHVDVTKMEYWMG